MRITLIATFALLGCGTELSPTPDVPLASLSPNNRALVSAADTNGDGVVDGHELARLYAKRTRAAFRALDRNRDGKLDRTEVPTALIAGADRDHDGSISLAEFIASHNARVIDRVHALDVNGDGVLEPAELGALRWTRLQTADANGDGVITRDEVDHSFGRKAR